ncbi:MAG: universal stress protein [Micropruina sp.]|uniref:universal stress protein n=1 Tax=Micropruina sp. TaxID=2737536 RepID=UPI0039E3789D
MPKPYTGPPPILVGYDASDDAVRALDYAARIAAASKTMLQLVYVADDTVVNSAWGVVFDDSGVQATARRLLAEAALAAHALGVAKKRIRVKVAVGSPIGVLTQLSENCSMVVVGRRANTSYTRQFSGSTSVGLAASVRCPLVVVADAAEYPQGPVGVALDASEDDCAALDWVLGNPLFAGKPVTVVSVCKAPQSRIFRSSLSPEQIELAIQQTAAQQATLVGRAAARHPDAPRVSTEVRYGSPVDELASFSETVSVLVIGADVRFPTYAVGSVARGVMTHAGCPVVLVK